jgi:TolB protein
MAPSSSWACGLAVLLTALAAGCGSAPGGEGPPEPPCGLQAEGAQWLAFMTGSGVDADLQAVREDGTCLSPLVSVAGVDAHPSWAKSGQLAYMSTRSGTMRVYVRDTQTGMERLLDTGTLSATTPTWSPDARSIAFEGYVPGAAGTSDIYVVPAAGGEPLRITTTRGLNAGPAWSPDGSTIFFVSNRTGTYKVWRVDVSSGVESDVPNSSGVLGRPAASPDGTAVAFTLPVSGAAGSGVVVVTLTTGARRVVSVQSDSDPAYDASGERMAVRSYRSGHAELWLLDVATGSPVRQLTALQGNVGTPSFRPAP